VNRLISFAWAILVIAFLIWASGCGPVLNAQSLPPPGRTAAFESNDGHYDLAISQGVAIAISCYHDGACKNVVVSTDDAHTADVKGASVGVQALAAATNLVDRNAIRYSTASTAGFVIIGKNPGTTKVKVKTSNGNKTINVKVIAPPVAGAPATVAGPAT